MKEETKTTILDSARYLRQIRPIDPTELVNYVEEDINASEIEQLLTEYSVAFELVKRNDGSFIAADDEPITVAFDGVKEVPSWIDDHIEQALAAQFGDEWASGRSGDRLRSVISEFKQAYFSGEAVDYDEETVLGYALYHFPPSFASIQYVLSELTSASLLPGSLRVLDIGAGVGGQALGLCAFLPDDVLVEYHAIEPSRPATKLLQQLLAETGPNVHPQIDTTPIETASITTTYDLILCSNVVNELAEPQAVIITLLSHLTETGSLIIVEPADKHTSRELRRIERCVLDATDTTLFSPTIRLWPSLQPTDDCWSFIRQPDLMIPRTQRLLDEGPRDTPQPREPATGEFINVDVQYSYSIIRQDDQRRIPVTVSRSTYMPLADAASHVTERVRVAVVKLSQKLNREADANPLFVIGDGSQDAQWFAVQAVETHSNRFLSRAKYGDVLFISNGLVLWNDDESAYNLVIDDRSVIDLMNPDGYQSA